MARRKRNTASAGAMLFGDRTIKTLKTLGAIGPTRAVSAETLCDAIGVSPSTGEAMGNGAHRGLRKRIAEARDAGYLIGSGKTGYYVPTTPVETLEFVEALEARALGMLTRAARMRETLIAMFGGRA